MISAAAVGIVLLFWKLFVSTAPKPPSPKKLKCTHCGYLIPEEEGPCSGGCQIFEFKFRHRSGVEEGKSE